MLYTNQHILGVFDTQAETEVVFQKSLENVGAYTVTFHVSDEEVAGASAAVITATVRAKVPEIEYPSTGLEAITRQGSGVLVPSTGFVDVWSDSASIDSINSTGLAVSDSGFGYKALTVSMSVDSATATQYLVTAVLHTTTLKS